MPALAYPDIPVAVLKHARLPPVTYPDSRIVAQRTHDGGENVLLKRPIRCPASFPSRAQRRGRFGVQFAELRLRRFVFGMIFRDRAEIQPPRGLVQFESFAQAYPAAPPTA